jgi:hypothetical protein
MSGSGKLGLDALAMPGWGFCLALSAVTLNFDSGFISLEPIWPFKPSYFNWPFKPSYFNIILLHDVFQLFKKMRRHLDLFLLAL